MGFHFFVYREMKFRLVRQGLTIAFVSALEPYSDYTHLETLLLRVLISVVESRRD